MIKRNLVTILIFFSGLATGIALNWLTDHSCQAIYVNDGFDIAFSAIAGLVWMLLKTTAGICIYLLIRHYLKPAKKWKYIFFGLLPILVFYPLFANIPVNIKNAGMEEAICGKLTNNGMRTRAEGLTVQQYAYVMAHFSALPDVPPSARNISFDYDGDPFLGDYLFELKFECSVKEHIDQKGIQWEITRKGMPPGIMQLSCQRHN